MSYPTSGPYSGPGSSHRDDADRAPHSEHLPGGLLANGTRVLVRVHPGPKSVVEYRGTVVDRASVPAAYIAITSDVGGGRAVIFLGPGVVIEPLLDHPALG